MTDLRIASAVYKWPLLGWNNGNELEMRVYGGPLTLADVEYIEKWLAVIREAFMGTSISTAEAKQSSEKGSTPKPSPALPREEK